MKKEKWSGLLLSLIEGLAVTWNPFTMAVAVGVGSLLWVVTKYETTPLKNTAFLLGAFIGWIASLLTGSVPFYRWNGIWWMPAGLITGAVLGIPIIWYLSRKPEMHTFLNPRDN